LRDIEKIDQIIRILKENPDGHNEQLIGYWESRFKKEYESEKQEWTNFQGLLNMFCEGQSEEECKKIEERLKKILWEGRE